MYARADYPATFMVTLRSDQAAYNEIVHPSTQHNNVSSPLCIHFVRSEAHFFPFSIFFFHTYEIKQFLSHLFCFQMQEN